MVTKFLQKIPCSTFSWVLDRFLPKNAPNQGNVKHARPENPMLNFFLGFRQISPKNNAPNLGNVKHVGHRENESLTFPGTC